MSPPPSPPERLLPICVFKSVMAGLLMSAHAAPPADLVCPITRELFEDPVVASDGFTYEGVELLKWRAYCRMANRPFTSPMTREELELDFYPNITVRNLAHEWREQNIPSVSELSRSLARALARELSLFLPEDHQHQYFLVIFIMLVMLAAACLHRFITGDAVHAPVCPVCPPLHSQLAEILLDYTSFWSAGAYTVLWEPIFWSVGLWVSTQFF